jgi:predicted ATPase
VFTQLSASNFKSWASLEAMRLARVTGIFGTNSSGKTSLLQMLLLLKQTAASSDRAQPFQLGDDRSLVELGSFRDLAHGHGDGPIRLGVQWDAEDPVEVVDPTTDDELLFTATDFEFRTSVSLNQSGAMEVDEFSYRAGPAQVEMRRSKKKHRKASDYDLSATLEGREYLRRTAGRAWPLPAPVKSYGFPDEAIAYFQNSGFVSDLELELERQLGDRTYYLGPLRSLPRREYRWKGTHPEDVGLAGERAVEALLAAGERGRVNTRGFDSRGHARKRITVEEHVASWLQDLGLVHSFTVKRLSEQADIYRVLVRRSAESDEVFLTDVGFGVSQILPVLVLLAYVDEGSTVLLEQPEIHLHPAVQAGLADVLIEAATVRRVQVIVESHSEHLLRRLQRRVAEEKLSKSDVELYFADLQDGDSVLTRLDLNIFGEIENWPSGFFGDQLGEAAALTKAGIQRRGST